MTADDRHGPLGGPTVLQNQVVAVFADALALGGIFDKQAQLVV